MRVRVVCSVCFIGLFSLLIARSCSYFLSCRPFCHLVKVIEYAQVARFELISSGFLAFERAKRRQSLRASLTHTNTRIQSIFSLFFWKQLDPEMGMGSWEVGHQDSCLR